MYLGVRGSSRFVAESDLAFFGLAGPVTTVRPLLSPLVLLSPQFMLRGIAGLHLQSEFLVTVTVASLSIVDLKKGSI
jgi:hypothetical protein